MGKNKANFSTFKWKNQTVCVQTHLTPGVYGQVFGCLVLLFLIRELFVVAALQVLLLQSYHHPPAGSRARDPPQSHVLGHSWREKCERERTWLRAEAVRR